MSTEAIKLDQECDALNTAHIEFKKQLSDFKCIKNEFEGIIVSNYCHIQKLQTFIGSTQNVSSMLPVMGTQSNINEANKKIDAFRITIQNLTIKINEINDKIEWILYVYHNERNHLIKKYYRCKVNEYINLKILEMDNLKMHGVAVATKLETLEDLKAEIDKLDNIDSFYLSNDRKIVRYPQDTSKKNINIIVEKVLQTVSDSKEFFARIRFAKKYAMSEKKIKKFAGNIIKDMINDAIRDMIRDKILKIPILY